MENNKENLKSKETLHENLWESAEALQKNNVGNAVLEHEDVEDSVIRHQNMQETEAGEIESGQKNNHKSEPKSNLTGNKEIKTNKIKTNQLEKNKLESSQVEGNERENIKRENNEREFYGKAQPRGRQRSAQERKAALLKVTFLGVLAVLVIGLAVVQDSRMPWNVQQQLAALNQKAAPAVPAAGTEVQTASQAAADKPAETTALAADEDETNNTEKNAGKITKENAADTEERKQTTAAAGGSAFSWQLPAGGKIIKGYGYSYDKTWADYRFHSGVDIALAQGTTIAAVGDCKVTEVGKTKALGEYIRVDYGNNLVGYYFGMDVADALQVGSAVNGGAALGVVAAVPLQESGYESHYHFALLQDGKAVDPAKLMK